MSSDDASEDERLRECVAEYKMATVDAGELWVTGGGVAEYIYSISRLRNQEFIASAVDLAPKISDSQISLNNLCTTSL